MVASPAAEPRWTLTQSSSLIIHLSRGMAAQLVVVGHGLSFFGITQDYWFIQNSAVAVFFVLSGFVIPYSALGKSARHPRYGFAYFLVDRFARIYMGLLPALLFVVLIDLVSMSMFGSGYRYASAFTIQTFLGNVLLLQEFPVAPVITSFGSARPLWTVAVEWWIYLFFGWMFLRHRWKTEHPGLFWIGAAVLAIVPAFNWIAGRGNGLSMMWLMGTVIYVLLGRAPRLSARVVGVTTAVLALLAVARLASTGTAYDVVYVGLFAVGLFLVLSLTQHVPVAVAPALASSITFNAEFSYTLYLVHYSILDWLMLWRGPGLLGVAIGFVASNVVAILLYLAFERHYRRVASRLVAWLESRQLKRAEI